MAWQRKTMEEPARLPCTLRADRGTLYARAQAVVDTSSETRFQLDLHVSRRRSEGPFAARLHVLRRSARAREDANLRVVFIDRITVKGPDGKRLGTGSSQLIDLVAPVKDATGVESQLVLRGLVA